MIRGTAVEQHADATGHTGFRPSLTGAVVECESCPWQYPPTAAEPVTVTEDAHQHTPGCDNGTSYCPTRDYEANPPIGPNDPEPKITTGTTIGGLRIPDYAADVRPDLFERPNDPEPTPVESEVPVAQLDLDADLPTDPAPAMGPIDDDPGPEPAEPPTVPPLTLRARIENAIDRAMPFDVYDRDLVAEAIAKTVHAEVGAGADWTPRTEGTAMSPAQALAFILDLPEWSRISRLGQLLDQAELGASCYLLDHQGAVERAIAIGITAQRYNAALERIARLTSTVDQPETAEQNIIGQIAAEALVHHD